MNISDFRHPISSNRSRISRNIKDLQRLTNLISPAVRSAFTPMPSNPRFSRNIARHPGYSLCRMVHFL